MAVSRPSVLRQPRPQTDRGGDRCPWCDQAISHEKFEEIHARIEAAERQRLALFERRLREQAAREQAQAKAAVEQVQKEAAATVEKLQKDAVAREAAIRAEGKKAGEAAMAPMVAEADALKKEAERQVIALKAKQEAVLSKRLHEQREVLEKASTEAVNAEKAKAFNEKLKLDAKLQAMQRQLQQKRADELGEGAEVDLFEVLKAEFPDDRIKRVNKGTPGADIIHEVVHNGRVSGKIVYDSKNRSAWQNGYVAKLRKDQLAAEADHAVLSTMAFPAGARQLHVKDGVIIANPARVIVVVQMLRKHLLQTHSLRLSKESRNEKTARLYEFITSDRCVQLFDQIETLTEDLLEVDVKEKRAHDTTWSRRGELIKAAQRAHGTFVSEVERIIGTVDAKK
jgi:hypothetical protein